MDSFHVCLNCCLNQISGDSCWCRFPNLAIIIEMLILNVKLQSQNLALFVYSVVVLRFGKVRSLCLATVL